MDFIHLKRFSDFRGLDLRSSEILRPPGFARECKNLMHSDQGGLMPRFGYQYRAISNIDLTVSNIGEHGIFAYEGQDMLQNQYDELLGTLGAVGVNRGFAPLWRRQTHTAVITNANATVTNFTIQVVSGHFRAIVVRAGVTLLNFDLGIVGATTVAQLQTAVNAVSGLSMTIGAGTGSLYASLMEVGSVDIAASGGTYSLLYYSWAPVLTPRFQWQLATASVDTVNDTINMMYTALTGEQYANPLQNGDKVRFYPGPGGTLPNPLVAGNEYEVESANKKTIKLVGVNFATSGTAPYAITSVTVNPGATFWNYSVELQQTDNYRPVSSVQVRNTRLFSSGRVAEATYNSLSIRESAAITKYDSQSFYRAGMPRIEPFIAVPLAAPVPSGTYTDFKGNAARTAQYSVGGASTITAGYYTVQMKAVDKTGNIIEGTLTNVANNPLTITFPGASSSIAQLTVSPRDLSLVSRLGFNTNYAVTSGTLTSLHIGCTDNFGNQPTIRVGDIAYFWDDTQERFIQREVVDRDSSSITISSRSLDLDPNSPTFDNGQTPTTLTGAAISANVRIVVWRSVQAGSADAKYLVEELPWSPYYTVYYDDKADDDLGAQLIQPAYNPDLPPPARYLAKLNDQVIALGNEAKDRTVYFEDIDTPEGYPSGTHEFDLPKRATAAAQTGPFLICTTNDSLHEVSGDLSEFKFRVDQIGHNIGCTSHFTMQEVEEGVLFFQSLTGPYVLSNGRQLTPLGPVKAPDGRIAGRLEPYFTDDYSSGTVRPAFQRSIGAVFPDRRWYVLYVPVEGATDYGVSKITDTVGTGSIAYVYDYGRSSWYRWLNIDLSGMAVYQRGLHFCTRATDAIAFYGQFLMTHGLYNFSDHTIANTWDWQSHWESLANPGVLKKFLRCRISSHEQLAAASNTFDLNTFIDYNPTVQSNDDTLTWTTQLDLNPKLFSENVRSMLVQFTANTRYEPMIISGYELEAVAPYRQVFKE